MPKDICKLAAVLIISLMIGTGCSQKNKLKPVYEGFPVQSINELLQLKKRVELKIAGDDSILGGVASLCKLNGGYVVCDDHQAKIALAYDWGGNLISPVGALGPGPGEYHCADVLCNNGEHLLIFNHNPTYVNLYDLKFNFVKRIQLPYKPYRLFVHHKKYFMYAPCFWSTVQLGIKVAVFDFSFKPVAAMRSYEETLERVPFLSGDCELVGDLVWFSDIYDPVVHVCTQDGKKV